MDIIRRITSKKSFAACRRRNLTPTMAAREANVDMAVKC